MLWFKSGFLNYIIWFLEFIFDCTYLCCSLTPSELDKADALLEQLRRLLSDPIRAFGRIRLFGVVEPILKKKRLEDLEF